MFCTLTALAGQHSQSAICKEGVKRNKHKMQNLQCIRASRRIFQVLQQPIETVTNFNYLGHIVTSQDNDWAAARRNLQKSRQRWTMISGILTRETASPRILALFYKATIQTVLLYGSETWVITNEILQLLTSFHHGIARQLTRRFPHPIPNTDEWNHPSIQETLQIAGLFPITEYLKQRRGYLEQYARQLSILHECQASIQTENPTRRVFWWNQPLANTTLLTTQDNTDEL
jgi:hypothetical protein